jgi:hydroxysqualene dehydroxylase
MSPQTIGGPSRAGRPTVAVVGGGLAGITAALRLADVGWNVTLLEAKPRLGGLTASFRRDDLDVDTGQHVFMRCCTSYRALLDRLHVTGQTTLQPRLDVRVVRAADGRRGRLHRDHLPVVAGLPLHLGRTLAGYRVMSVKARLAAIRATLALRGLDAGAAATDEESFGGWLSAHGQPQEAIDGLWDLVGVATLNARADEASLALAATVFQLGLLTSPGAADIGWSAVPLQELHGDAAARELSAAGVEVRFRTKVDAIASASPGYVVHTGDETLAVAAVVVAVEPAQAERILPAAAVALPQGWAAKLGESPIVNVHAVFDRTVMDESFLACIGSPLQWLFDRTTASGLSRSQSSLGNGGRAQYVAASVSAADDLSALPVGEIRARLLPEFERVLPRSRGAEVLDFFVTREPHATFRQAPGSARWRPATATNWPGLVLAGAHTATGWPATMEGAVRSGEAAADRLQADRRSLHVTGVAA